MISFSDPHKTLVGLHGMLTGWQSIRERRRMRYSPPAATSPPPPVSMHSPPVGAPPAPGPAGTVIAFHKLGDRIIPIYGDPAELADAAARASANGAPSPSEARSAEAPAPQAPPQAAPDASSDSPAPQRSPQTPPPPDFTPQAVEASAPRRSPAAPPTLDLPPPTPPPLVRADEQAVTLERVLADHRVQLARQTEAQQALHAATMEAILAEHRRAQAQADQEHRQQLGELLAKHREEAQHVAQTTGEHGQALVDLREFLAEQASAMQVEHARIGEKIESIVDIVGMVGETVHHIAAVALEPKALFGALPTRPNNAAASSITDRPMQASPQPAVSAAPPILLARPPVQQPSPQPATVEQPAPPTASSLAAAQPTGPGASRVPAEPSHQAPPSTATGPRSTATAGGATLSRTLGFTPAASEVLSLASTQPSTLTPRQLRAEAAARERSRLDDALDLTLDDYAEPDDAPDPSEAPHA